MFPLEFYWIVHYWIAIYILSIKKWAYLVDDPELPLQKCLDYFSLTLAGILRWVSPERLNW